MEETNETRLEKFEDEHEILGYLDEFEKSSDVRNYVWDMASANPEGVHMRPVSGDQTWIVFSSKVLPEEVLQEWVKLVEADDEDEVVDEG